MTSTDLESVLLALDAGVRETGWAVFSSGDQVATGCIGVPGRRRMDAQARLSHLIQGLDRLVEQWRPVAVAHSQPSGIHWPMPALELLETALREWCQRHQLRLFAYSAQTVRAALTGHPNASREDLAYAVMSGMGLIGQGKTTHEWEAIAVGHYHLTRQHDGDDSSAAAEDAP